MKTKKLTPPQDKRIYCVVASTVQVCQSAEHGELHVQQPLGRQVAQACHAVSKVRVAMCRSNVFNPITTIILEARDSRELQHVLYLLQKNKTPVYEFFDTEQPDYGNATIIVRTAIATEPVTREDMIGVLDYLPLWGSK